MKMSLKIIAHIALCLYGFVQASPLTAPALEPARSVKLARRFNATQDMPVLADGETLGQWFDALDAEDGSGNSSPGITLVGTESSTGDPSSGGIPSSKRDYAVQNGWRTVTFEDGGTSFTAQLATCIKSTDIMGTYIDRFGVTNTDATAKYITDDLKHLADHTYGDRDEEALQQHALVNLNAALDDVNGYLSEAVCDYSNDHDELRKLLSTGFWTGLFLGGAVGGPLVGAINYGINNNQTFKAVAATAVGTACAIWIAGAISYISQQGIIARAESAAVTALTARVRALEERAAGAGRQIAQSVSNTALNTFNQITGNPGYETGGSCDTPETVQQGVTALGQGASLPGQIQLNPITGPATGPEAC